jgi:proton-coupled amino acid transporter
MMALSIFLSYALQFYVPVDIIWPNIKPRIPTERMQMISEYVFRTVLVIITCKYNKLCLFIHVVLSKCLVYDYFYSLAVMLAELIPHLGLFISLVGAVSSSTLALIFPPVINILTNWSYGYGKYHWSLWKDLALMTFGSVGFLAGTYVSVENILAGASDAGK